MPTFVHGKHTRVIYDDHDLSEYFNAADTNDEIETADATTFSGTRKRKVHISGMEDAAATLSGLWSGDANGADEVLHAAIADADATSAIMIARSGLAIGSLAEFFIARETSYSVSSPIGDVVSTSLSAQSSSGIDTGLVLSAGASLTATADLAGVDQEITTEHGGAAHLHVLTNTHDGATTAIVQHSADGSTWVDLVTFAAVPAGETGVQRVVLPVDDEVLPHLRARVELAGADGGVSVVVAFARYY